MPDVDTPALLEPLLIKASPHSRLNYRFTLALGILASTTLFLSSGFVSDSPNDATTSSLAGYHAPAGSIAALVPASDHDAIESALDLIQIEPPALEQLKAELKAGEVQLGVARVWDWADADGDQIIVSSAGFQQTVTISATPSVVIIPVGDDRALSLIPVRDGMGGGVTVAFSSGTQNVTVRALSDNQAVMLALP